MKTSNFWQKVLVVSGFLAIAGTNMGVAEAYRSNNYVNKGGCYLQKEYNYFMNQWTTNEVCRPNFVEVPVQEKTASPYSTLNNTDNVFLGPSYSNSYVAPTTYYTGPTVSNTYRGFYTGNNQGSLWNSWNGYGSASNYLLSSFGGGIGSYGYYNNYYPSSVFTYTPTSYSYSVPNYYYTNYQDDYDYNFGVGFGYYTGLYAQGYSDDKINYMAGEDFGITIYE
jgi:hypothetical protein